MNAITEAEKIKAIKIAPLKTVNFNRCPPLKWWRKNFFDTACAMGYNREDRKYARGYLFIQSPRLFTLPFFFSFHYKIKALELKSSYFFLLYLEPNISSLVWIRNVLNFHSSHNPPTPSYVSKSRDFTIDIISIWRLISILCWWLHL